VIVVSGIFERTYERGQPLASGRFIGPAPKLARMDRLCGLAMVAANEALGDSALEMSDIRGDRSAIVFGSALGCHATNEAYYRQLLNEGPSPRLFSYTLPSSPAGEISIHLDATGPATTLVSGRTAGLDALCEAHTLLFTRRADRAICVSSEVGTTLADQLVGPTHDATAALILERDDDVARRGGVVRGRLAGWAKRGATEPHAVAIREAIVEALGRAEIGAGAIGAVYGHADAVDVAERLGLKGTIARDSGLATGPLQLAVRSFADGVAAHTLLVASDLEGTATAVVISR
jgi:hypothetical protein